jgi:hypothetical protein
MSAAAAVNGALDEYVVSDAIVAVREGIGLF